MKIGYFGDGPWAHRALENILKKPNLEIAFIVARFDKCDTILRKFAEQINVPFLLHPDVNSDDFLDKVNEFAADIYVSMSFNQILKRRIIQSIPKGFINCHAGALPFYRGRNILNWALINGEKSFGITVHYVDEGIDTGDIILQHIDNIDENDDYATLLERAIRICSTLLPEALDLIDKGKSERIKQSTIDHVGFYCSRRMEGDEWIDWSLSSKRIHNLVRGISIPGPCARTLLNGKTIAIVKSEIINEAPSYIDKPGNVVGRGERGVHVKTGDSKLLILKIGYVDENGKVTNIHIPKISIGASFTVNVSPIMLQLNKRINLLEKYLSEIKLQDH